MTVPDDVERFAAYLRGLKQRAGISFGELAKQTGVSKASIHRYCSGVKVPASYGVVHTIATTCGGSSKELQELHRLWALAQAGRSPTRSAEENETVSSEPPPDPIPPKRRRNPRAIVITLAVAAAITLVLTAVLLLAPVFEAEPSSPPSAIAPIRVYNIEGDCKDRTEKVPACSMGLAIDPKRKYAAGNVVSHRVWHGDVLYADCVLYDGDRVEDETGVGTTRWFRVRLNEEPGGHAWLPAVRTHDNPPLPTC